MPLETTRIPDDTVDSPVHPETRSSDPALLGWIRNGVVIGLATVAAADAHAADPAPNQPRTVAVSKEKVDQLRESLRTQMEGKSGEALIDSVRKLGETELFRSSPEGRKAVTIVVFNEARRTTDVANMYVAVREMLRSVDVFTDAETKACLQILKEAAEAKKNQAVLYRMADDFEKAGVVSAGDALTMRIVSSQSLAMDREFRKDQAATLALAEHMLSLAVEVCEDDPLTARKLLLSASGAAGREPPAEFTEKAKKTKLLVDEGQKFYDATLALAKDPANERAKSTVADYEFGHGNVPKGLELMAGSASHPHRALAKETIELQTRGGGASAREAVKCAQSWIDVSKTQKNGSQQAALAVAKELIAIFEKSTTDKDLVVQASGNQAKQLLGIIASPVVKSGTPAPGETARATPSTETVSTKPSSEPKRPEYVLKEAVWNEKTSSWYYLAPEPMKFSELAKLAAEHSGTVASPEDMEENEFIYRLQGKDKNSEIWTGITKGPDGKLYTPDGRPIAYNNWAPNEGTLPNEKHVFLMWGAKHADSYPDVMKAKGVIKWKYVSPKTIATDRAITGKRPR